MARGPQPNRGRGRGDHPIESKLADSEFHRVPYGLLFDLIADGRTRDPAAAELQTPIRRC